MGFSEYAAIVDNIKQGLDMVQVSSVLCLCHSLVAERMNPFSL